MKAIFLEVEYLGTHYFGFQIQNRHSLKEITVQAVLEKALKKLFNQDIRIDYTSRTDAGVHAKTQGVSFCVDTNIPLNNIKRALNSFLPWDIKIIKIKEYPAPWRVRYCVKSKIYRYTICNTKEQSVFDYQFSWHVKKPLNLAAMKKIAPHLIGKKDFSRFAKKSDHYRSCVRDVKKIVIKKSNKFIFIDIEADGFLHNMVRNIVNFLVECGLNEITRKEALAILADKKDYHCKPALARGLCLTKVFYG